MLVPRPSMIETLRKKIASEVVSHTGLAIGGIDYGQPPGDPGLFGPATMPWRVHGDFSCMLVGGMSALLLQMLHPLALAGVWDHSNFRADMLGRLRRTGQFVAGTTFAARADAERLIARVRAIHDGVSGVSPDGVAYSANDPALLTWVHVAEVRSFLAAHIRFLEPTLPQAEQDRYYDEIAEVAIRLGARGVPRSSAAVAQYLDGMRPQLRFDERTQSVLDCLRQPPTTNAGSRLYATCALDAAVDVLPAMARGLVPAPSPLRRAASGTVVRGAAVVLRWALRDGARVRARRRLGLPPR